MTATIGGWALVGAQRLEAAGWPAAEARQDVGALARALLGWDLAAWLSRQQDPVPREFPARFDAALARRTRHEPVAYISGEREFFGRPFEVGPAVLIPRPETELVVETALRHLPPASARATAPTVVDVGTGSGCVAVTVALERPDLHVVATDISEPALAVARRNARRHGVESRVRLMAGALLADVQGPVDLVVSNPPYVATRDRTSLATEVVAFEPAVALFGGLDGLAIIRELLPAAARTLAAGAPLVMEIGAGQADAVEALTRQAGLQVVGMEADLQRILRVLVARRVG